MPEEVPFKIEGHLPEQQLHALFDFLERTGIVNSVRVELGPDTPEDRAVSRALEYSQDVFDPRDNTLKPAVTLDGFKAFAAEASFTTPVATRAWNSARNGFNSIYDWEIEALKDVPRISYPKQIAHGRHTINVLAGFEAATFHQSLRGLINEHECLRNCGPSTVAFYEAFLASLFPEHPTPAN